MKHLLRLAGIFFLAVVLRADGDFTKSLTPSERAEAGLAKLTPVELAKLVAVVEHYKRGEVAVVQNQAATKIAVAEAKVKEAESKVASSTEDKSKPSWLRALITLKQTGENPKESDAFTSRIDGKFSGWSGRTFFKLANGQVWQQQGGGDYVGSKMDSPAVKIYPGAIGSFWMEVEDVNPRVRVKLVKLD